MICCKSTCCGYEFDKVGLYINFFDEDWHDIRALVEKFQKDHNIDLRNTEIIYYYPERDFITKEGLHEIWENLEYLESLSVRRHNVFNEFVDSNKSKREMFENLVNSKSLALFVGNFNRDMEYWWNEFIVDGRLMCVHLTPDEYEPDIWIGNPIDPKILVNRNKKDKQDNQDD